MAKLAPFSGIRYNQAICKDLFNVVAPPYDVLSDADVARLQALSPYNVSHLTRPVGEDKYNHAAQLWRDWTRNGVLQVDEEPSFYAYQQTFVDPDTGNWVPPRCGLVCLLRLEDYSSGKVMPHENTHLEARVDRLNLLRATQVNLESIYGLYSDPDRSVESFLRELSDREPVIENVTDASGSHRLERIAGSTAIEALCELLADKPVFIADGHHRYETSLAFGAEGKDDPARQYLLVTLTALEDEGLLVLPTHRVVTGIDTGLVDSLPGLLRAEGFEVSETSSPRVPQEQGKMTLVLPNSRAYTVVFPPDAFSRVSGPASRSWKELDVSILHSLVLEEMLGIPMAQLATTDKIGYTRFATEAIDKIGSSHAQAAFLLARPSVEEMRAVSVAGDKMPQKSTYFYPKLLSGLVMRDLRV